LANTLTVQGLQRFKASLFKCTFEQVVSGAFTTVICQSLALSGDAGVLER
jgi:hypothetical protein